MAVRVPFVAQANARSGGQCPHRMLSFGSVRMTDGALGGTAMAEIDLAPYLDHARRWRQVERRALAERREQAWTVARQAAEVLRTRWGAQRVVVFGSLTQEGRLSPWSDIDLAVWGLEGTRCYAALADVLDLTSEFTIDLVDPDDLRPAMREVVQQQGVEL